MAIILCTGADASLLQTRKLILEQAGYTVIPAMTQPAVLAACTKARIEVAVIGQSVSSDSKKAVASIVRQHCPSSKILELFQANQGRTLGDADAWLEVPADVPQHLAECVAELLIPTCRAEIA